MIKTSDWLKFVCSALFLYLSCTLVWFQNANGSSWFVLGLILLSPFTWHFLCPVSFPDSFFFCLSRVPFQVRSNLRLQQINFTMSSQLPPVFSFAFVPLDLATSLIRDGRIQCLLSYQLMLSICWYIQLKWRWPNVVFQAMNSGGWRTECHAPEWWWSLKTKNKKTKNSKPLRLVMS